MVEYVQEIIGYHFVNPEILKKAFQAAHRDDENGTSDDGHRGMATIGVHVIELVEACDSVIENNKTKREINSRKHWSRTKQGRATTCHMLGIDSLIIRSSRQKDATPSTVVLSHTMSAVIGAVWLDLQNKDEGMMTSLQVILGVLRRIDSFIEDLAGETVPANIMTRLPNPEREHSHQLTTYERTRSTTTQDMSDDCDSNDTSFEVPRDCFGRLDVAQPETSLSSRQEVPIALHYDPEPPRVIEEIDFNSFMLPRLNTMLECQREQPEVEDERHALIIQEPSLLVGYSTSPTIRKRKKAHVPDERIPDTHRYDEILRTEKQRLGFATASDREALEKYLEHPLVGMSCKQPVQAMQLRFIYLAIGGSQSLINFWEQLSVARQQPFVNFQRIAAHMSPYQRFSEICRLENEEIVCALRRRYHALRLCEVEEATIRQENCITSAISSSGMVSKASRGNPKVMQEAAITKDLTRKIMMESGVDNKEYGRYYAKIKRLRGLARRLRMLTQHYGFGVLALIPSGSSHVELSITDTALIEISESDFRAFTDLLHQQQGSFLRRLSQAIEPAFIALMDTELAFQPPFLIECMNQQQLANLPKGSSELSGNCFPF